MKARHVIINVTVINKYYGFKMETVEVGNENSLQSLVEEPEPSYTCSGNDTSDVCLGCCTVAVKEDRRMLSTPASSFVVPSVKSVLMNKLLLTRSQLGR